MLKYSEGRHDSDAQVATFFFRGGKPGLSLHKARSCTRDTQPPAAGKPMPTRTNKHMIGRADTPEKHSSGFPMTVVHFHGSLPTNPGCLK